MNEAYEVDKDTKVMVAIKLLAAYRTIIPCNLLGLLEVRDVYYEPMYIVIKRINCIVIPLPLHHIYITTKVLREKLTTSLVQDILPLLDTL